MDTLNFMFLSLAIAAVLVVTAGLIVWYKPKILIWLSVAATGLYATFFLAAVIFFFVLPWFTEGPNHYEKFFGPRPCGFKEGCGKKYYGGLHGRNSEDR